MKRIIETFNKIIFVVFILFMIIGFNDCTVGVFEGGSDLSALNIKYYNTNEKSELGKPENYAVHYFSNLLENFGNNRFETCGFVSLGMILSFYDTYWDVFSYSKEFQIDEYEWAYNIKPVDYAFPRTTVTSQTDTFKSGDGTIIYTQGRMVSATNRGFIKMTPQRIGQHESWLTFHFSRQIMSLSVQLSRWLSEENLVLPSISLFSLESYKNGHWIEEVNLLSLDDRLPLGELNAKWYHFTFSETVDTFRFRLGVSSGLLQNGSVCIGNIAAWRNLPTSGSELQFDLIQWNKSNIKTFSSSFGYSLNNQTYPGSGYIWDNQQPGQFGFREIQPPYTYERVFNYLNADFEYYNQCMDTNLSLEKIDKFETCKPGSYKIAFALCGDQFSTYMLWFRQDNDGYWSTKKAGLAPTQYDDNGNRILDPEYCCIDGYQEFIGFYSVNPWGNLYYE